MNHARVSDLIAERLLVAQLAVQVDRSRLAVSDAFAERVVVFIVVIVIGVVAEGGRVSRGAGDVFALAGEHSASPSLLVRGRRVRRGARGARQPRLRRGARRRGVRARGGLARAVVATAAAVRGQARSRGARLGRNPDLLHADLLRRGFHFRLLAKDAHRSLNVSVRCDRGVSVIDR